MVWKDGKDQCWHCGSHEHDTAGHPHEQKPAPADPETCKHGRYFFEGCEECANG